MSDKVLGYVVDAGSMELSGESFDFVFVVRFRNAEDFRQAMVDRNIDLTLFPDRSELE